ncbi:hypothetical protein SELMODRAFT_419995 [Selaginella moellendorffii]|uniref:Uncharacterized protein n=1 Tax=Selaginella moellendorffii TaxID=88036 RepID=D8SA80_SELML|nr:hypothetical protein SELMODRAFT_419995 [Selaginella moellendorffii]
MATMGRANALEGKLDPQLSLPGESWDSSFFARDGENSGIDKQNLFSITLRSIARNKSSRAYHILARRSNTHCASLALPYFHKCPPGYANFSVEKLSQVGNLAQAFKTELKLDAISSEIGVMDNSVGWLQEEIGGGFSRQDG